MSGFKNGLEYHTQSLKSDQDEKLEIASRASKTGAEYSDDPTRSTLHTGEFASGKLEDRERMEGAPSEPSLNSTGDQPQNTVETTTDQTAPLVGRSFASGQSPASTQTQDPDRLPTSDSELPPISQGTPQTTPSLVDVPMAEIPLAGAPHASEKSPTSDASTAEVEVNVAPDSVAIDGTTIAENTSGAVVGTITVGDPNKSDTHRFEVSDDRFEVADGQLRLKPGVALNFENSEQIDIDVTVTDKGGLSLTERFSVSVLDVNEAPTGLSLNNATGNLIKNGGFEEFEVDNGGMGVFAGNEASAWTNAHGIEVWNNFQSAEASEGTNFIEMDSEHGLDSISQTITTDKGQLYDLGVDLRERLVDGTDSAEVYWNGNLIAELNPQSTDWETFQLRVVGTGHDKLELREADDQNDSLGALVDNISLTAATQTVAENIKGAIVGQISFDDPDAGDTHRFEVSDSRFEVSDGQLRLKPGMALNHEESDTISVDVTVIDNEGLSETQSFSVHVADMDEVSFSTGFRAKYFDIDARPTDLDDIDWNGLPFHQELKPDVSFERGEHSSGQGGPKNLSGVEVTGNIQIEEGGTFSFFLDGSKSASLWVDGVNVIESDGARGLKNRSGEIELEPGTHAIEVRYVEHPGRHGLQLELEGPGIDGRELVSAPELAEAQTVSGMPITFDVDPGTLDLSGDARFSLKNLPEGTIVEAGVEVTVVDAGGSVELTGWQGDLLVISPPSDFTGTINAELHYSMNGGESGGLDALQTLTFDVHPAHLNLPSAELVGGFQASYFDVDHRLTKLNDINWDGEPTHQELVPEINFENGHGSFWEGGSKDTFGARLTGKISVEEGGDYTFFAGGDDGVEVFIDGEKVINNDGLHSFRTRTGEVELDPGTYEVEVRYFENYGRAGLKLEWEGPDTEGRELVRADLGTSVETNGTFELGIDLQDTSDQGFASIDGLPAQTLIISGEDTVLSDGGAVDLQGWDLSLLEISPPPGFEGTINAEIIISDKGFNGAQVTSVNSFSLEVGQTNGLAKGMMPDEMEPFSLAPDTAQDSSLAWDMDQTSQKEAEDTDVMTEEVLSSHDTQISSIDTDSYERADW